jgi:hypothetical protein
MSGYFRTHAEHALGFLPTLFKRLEDHIGETYTLDQGDEEALTTLPTRKSDTSPPALISSDTSEARPENPRPDQPNAHVPNSVVSKEKPDLATDAKRDETRPPTTTEIVRALEIRDQQTATERTLREIIRESRTEYRNTLKTETERIASHLESHHETQTERHVLERNRHTETVVRRELRQASGHDREATPIQTKTAESPTQVNISIGRIEVKPSARPDTPGPRARTPREESISLNDYLRERSGGQA